MNPNATYLFEKPRREFHNAELWWTSYFTLFSFWASSSGYLLVLPTYCYSAGDRLEENGKLSLEKCNYQSTVVDGKLRGDVFGMKDWPNRFRDLKPDVTIIHSRESREVSLIEVKTIGASVKGNALLYADLRDRLLECQWRVGLYYLLSRGHEENGDWPVLRNIRASIILWEDVLQKAIDTPFENVFGEPLQKYAKET